METELKFLLPLEGENYDGYINRILNSRDNIKIPNAYMECHHIIPRCLGGSNEETNLIYLYPEEHYAAHKLLSLENPGNDALLNA